MRLSQVVPFLKTLPGIKIGSIPLRLSRSSHPGRVERGRLNSTVPKSCTFESDAPAACGAGADGATGGATLPPFCCASAAAWAATWAASWSASWPDCACSAALSSARPAASAGGAETAASSPVRLFWPAACPVAEFAVTPFWAALADMAGGSETLASPMGAPACGFNVAAQAGLQPWFQHSRHTKRAAITPERTAAKTTLVCRSFGIGSPITGV